MTVLLRSSRELDGLPADATHVHMANGAGISPGILEEAFDKSGPEWWDLGKTLSAEPSAILAHAPACVANASDFGVMLAWTRLVETWANEGTTTVFVCDDPWMFRHLRELPGVIAGRAPSLLQRRMRLYLRGLAARCAVTLRIATARRPSSGDVQRDTAWLLVYGHPASTGDGMDGYFGDLMHKLPFLRRVVHVDCPPRRACALGVSLHGYGYRPFALTLPFVRWRPKPPDRHRWLVRRAAAREGGTGQAAMIRWQLHCQRRFLRRARPRIVAWPWENHSWERDFVRAARRAGVRTVGYQHSVVGRQMLNYAPKSNPDGLASIPDRVLCSGAATRDQLARWGVPDDRLGIGGALRFQRRSAPGHATTGPVFMALPFDGVTAAEMVEAARRASARHNFLVKDHPMTPFAFDPSPGVERTELPLERHKEVSAVVYAATTVGLEAALARLPTLRFRPRGRIALDILPDGVQMPTVDADGLAAALDHPAAPGALNEARIFAPVDEAAWRAALT